MMATEHVYEFALPMTEAEQMREALEYDYNVHANYMAEAYGAEAKEMAEADYREELYRSYHMMTEWTSCDCEDCEYQRVYRFEVDNG